jgi:hypothetical protein
VGEFIAYLIAAPFVALRDMVRLWLRWKHVPLAQKNQIRAGLGGFLCALAVGLAVVELPQPAERLIEPIRVWLIAGLAGFGALYLVVGVLGSQGARVDFMSLVWWGVLGLGCAALLVFGSPI